MSLGTAEANIRERRTRRRLTDAWAAGFIAALAFLVCDVFAANETYTYDSAGRLITVDHGDGRTTNYTLDAAGNRTNVTTAAPGAAGVISIVNASATYPESAGNVSIALRRAEGTSGAVSVTVAASFNGTAASNDATVSPASVSWVAGDSTDKSVTVNIVDDAAVEPNETFSIVISGPTGGATLGSPSSITLTIANNDTPETTPPTAPTSLTASAVSASQINLTWTASTDASGISNYRVERCSGGSCSNFTEIGTPSGTSFNDTGRAEATSYSYRVRAVDGVNNTGPYSSVASAMTLDSTAPTAPSGLAASAVSAVQVNLTWTAATDNVAVTGYRVERCTGSGCSSFEEIGTPSGTSFNDTGRAEATAYSYRVRAVDGANNPGPYSSVASAMTPDVTAPTAPGSLTANAISATRIDLAWSAANDNVAVTGYRIERCAGSSCSNFAQIQLVGAPVLSYADTSVAQLTTYRYRVYAVDAVPNSGAFSSVATASTPDGTPPTVPGGLAATVVSHNRIDLSWTAASDNIAVTGYKVYRNGSPITTVSATSYSDGVLAPSTQYSFQVSAVDAANNESGLTAVVQATTQPMPDETPPTVPQGVTGTAPSSTQVNLSWGASTDTGGSGLAGYRVYRNGTLLNPPVAPSVTPSFTDTGTSGTTAYSYTVKSYDGAGNESAASNPFNITTPDTLPPDAPSGLTATAITGALVRLNWNVPNDPGGSGLACYRVYRGGTLLPTPYPCGPTYDDTTVSAGVTYSYTVKARDMANLESPHSNTATVTTPAALAASVAPTYWAYESIVGQPAPNPPPVVVTASGGAGGYTYLWERVSGDTLTSVISPTSASTKFSRSLPNQSATFTSLWRCRVTDSANAVVYTANVTVEFTRENGD